MGKVNPKSLTPLEAHGHKVDDINPALLNKEFRV